MSEKDSIRLSLKLPSEVNERLEEIASELCVTKTELLRRALLLLDVAHSSKKDRKSIGIFDPETKQLEKEFIGI